MVQKAKLAGEEIPRVLEFEQTLEDMSESTVAVRGFSLFFVYQQHLLTFTKGTNVAQ